jgi:uncharacterized membrane protein
MNGLLWIRNIFVPSVIITVLCSFITPKIGEAIRIISIYDVFATPASVDWTVPTATGIFYGNVLTIVIFVLSCLVIWAIFEKKILEKLNE